MSSIEQLADWGYVAAQYNIAKHYARENDMEKAIYWWTQAANQGDTESQAILGDCYSLKNDFKTAAFWRKKAASQGDPNAQYELALQYFRGEGVEENASEGIRLMKEAVKNGHKVAKEANDAINKN